ncbi:hypothetical protein AAHA92_17505 [Salvia divinorum]|uniref:Uncharacterized protein n=1 Tax=Salvia divinorum TaxID=28513 RepID=A0ABD1H1V0_SALDI
MSCPRTLATFYLSILIPRPEKRSATIVVGIHLRSLNRLFHLSQRLVAASALPFPSRDEAPPAVLDARRRFGPAASRPVAPPSSALAQAASNDPVAPLLRVLKWASVTCFVPSLVSLNVSGVQNVVTE